MRSISKHSTRFFAAFLAVMLLLAAVCAAAVSAEEAEDVAAVPTLYVEPTVITADDYTSVVTGFSVYLNTAEPLTSPTLTVDVGVYGDPTGLYTNDVPASRDWITVTTTETGDEDAADARPDYIVDFHKPADVNVEDAAYLELPAFLRAVRVADTELYVLAPGYEIFFAVTAGTMAEDGSYPHDYRTSYCEETVPVVTFDLARPQKFMAKLDQPENTTGILYTYYYYPESIHALNTALTENKDSFLKTYGLSDAVLSIQYDFTRLDTPSSYDPDAEADHTVLWDQGYLQPLSHTYAPSTYISGEIFPFYQEAFRGYFPEGTFTETEIPLAEGEDGDELTPSTYLQIDTENVTLTARARFVLAMTAADGTVYYNTSAFTDPFSCGASNSLVAEPTELSVPVLSAPVFETGEDGTASLYFDIAPNKSLLDVAVWQAAAGNPDLGYELEVSVNGSDWTKDPLTAEGLSLDQLIEGGTQTVLVSDENLNEYAYIRLRMRYGASLSADITLNSEWSDSLAFDKKPEETVTEPTSVNTIPLYTEDTASTGELKYVCPICGICPAPYGVCLFLWIGAALLIVLLIVLIIALIPKKKTCPRCTAPCHPAEKSCPVCGYRFVGSMPEIEDTTSDLQTADSDGDGKHSPSDEDFFAAMSATEGERTQKPAAASSVDVPLTGEVEAVPNPFAQKDAPAKETVASPRMDAMPAAPKARPAAAAAPVHTPLPAADPAFLAELKRKTAAVKAGQPQSFTPAEIAYIRALKEQKAAKAPAAADKAAVQTSAPTAQKASAEKPAAAQNHAPAAREETDADRIARLRALRAKQLAEEAANASREAPTAEMPAVTAEAKKAEPAAPKRVEKPIRQIKCPACAVPNPETNERCYICGGMLPK